MIKKSFPLMLMLCFCSCSDGGGNGGDADAAWDPDAFDGESEAAGEGRDPWADEIAEIAGEDPGDGAGDAQDLVEDDAGVEEPGPTCTLADSGPVVASADGQVFEYLRIVSTDRPAVTVAGFSNVVIRNCELHHGSGGGIVFSNAPNILIEDVVIVNDGAPPGGPNPSENFNNIEGEFSDGVVIIRARLVRGSAGIYLNRCPGAALSFIEGHDFRGPFPRGQVVQFNNCNDAVLEDFSCENPQDTSWPEDNVSVFQSSNVTVRRGLLDGNNAPYGVGVMFEMSDGGSSGGLCEDVDAIGQGNGCFSGYPARDVTYRRTRCRDNICTDQGRGEPPASGGLAWAGSPESSNLRLEASSYFNLCDGQVWDQTVFAVIELEEIDFVPRSPLRLMFCW